MQIINIWHVKNWAKSRNIFNNTYFLPLSILESGYMGSVELFGFSQKQTWDKDLTTHLFVSIFRNFSFYGEENLVSLTFNPLILYLRIDHWNIFLIFCQIWVVTVCVYVCVCRRWVYCHHMSLLLEQTFGRFSLRNIIGYYHLLFNSRSQNRIISQ